MVMRRKGSVGRSEMLRVVNATSVPWKVSVDVGGRWGPRYTVYVKIFSVV
jgi:hypothetical protein